PVRSGRIFKLQNMCNGSGILAVFNLDEEEKPVTGFVSPGDVEGLTGEEFAVYEHFSGDFQILKPEESIPLSLEDSNDYRLYVIVPLKDGCGMIGRTDKFISPATVRYDLGGNGELVEPGTYAYVEDRKLWVKN
ncbi:MAG: hypothetical protein ACI4PO_08895, partial [Faecousia sp.]